MKHHAHATLGARRSCTVAHTPLVHSPGTAHALSHHTAHGWAVQAAIDPMGSASAKVAVGPVTAATAAAWTNAARLDANGGGASSGGAAAGPRGGVPVPPMTPRTRRLWENWSQERARRVQSTPERKPFCLHPSLPPCPPPHLPRSLCPSWPTPIPPHHCPPCGESEFASAPAPHNRYVFRVYDIDQSGTLSVAELAGMVSHMQRAEGNAGTAAGAEALALEAVGGDPQRQITEEEFVSAVREPVLLSV